MSEKLSREEAEAMGLVGPPPKMDPAVEADLLRRTEAVERKLAALQQPAPAHRWTPEQEALIAEYLRSSEWCCGAYDGHGAEVTHVTIEADEGTIHKHIFAYAYCATHAPEDAIPLGTTEETT